MRVVLVGVLVILAGCAGPAVQTVDDVPEAPLPDPLLPGNLTSSLHVWRLDPIVVQGAFGAYPVDLHGEAVVPDGEGPYPVAIFMHGRHSTCRYAPGVVGFEFLGHPCPDATPVMEPVDSYTGYRYLAEFLASHGIASVSVSANDVNDYDLAMSAGRSVPMTGSGFPSDDHGATARGRIILALIAELKAAPGTGNDLDAFASTLDMANVGLMGHSRGGEGVVRAAVLNDDGPRHGIQAVMALAPTDFARWVMPEVPFGTILPYCDGDVSTLHGAWMYDDMLHVEAPRHQFLDMGANHNFYNTVWTGDDWSGTSDPYCAPDGNPASGRLDPEEQRRHGIALMGSFFRHYLQNETSFWPLLEGSRPFPIDVKVSSSAAHRSTLLPPHTGTACEGTGCPIPETYSRAHQAHADLGDELQLSIHGDRTARALSLRAGMHQDTSAAELANITLTIETASGDETFRLAEHGLFIPPGDQSAKTTLNQVWLPLDWDTPRDVRQLRIAGPAGVEIQVTDIDWRR